MTNVDIYLVRLEQRIAKYMVLGHKIHSTIEVVILGLYGDDVNMMRNLTCPYCGRRFNTRYGLWLHLNRSGSRMASHRNYPSVRLSIYNNKCYVAFQQVIEDIVNTYTAIKNVVRSCKKRRYYVRLGVSPYPKFRTKRDAFAYALTMLKEVSR